VIRRLYGLLWWLALPGLPLRLWWRARAEPGYGQAIGERFGRYAQPRPECEVVWVHAVSLGETRAAAPLVERILRERPHASVLLTHMTATGRAAGASLAGERVVQAWLPYDLPFAVRRFLGHFRPTVGVLLETEVWPALLAEASTRNVPVYLVNARMSAGSARGYARLGAFARRTFASLAGVAAQSADDAARLRALGAQDLTVTGNVKFDMAPDAPARERGATLRAGIGARPVWLAASTREGEEALLLDALEARGGALPAGALMLLVPRHPQRFDAVATLLRERNVRFARRSATAPAGGSPGIAAEVDASVQVLLGDTVGELMAYYAAADVAFVGGSLLPLGGQNLIEAIAAGVPVIVGPHTFNFAAAAEGAVAAGAALRAQSADDVVAQVAALLHDAPGRDAMRARGAAFLAAHAGALDRLWRWLSPRLDAAARARAGASG
jgi:3-deoxy-D-manno-octulosonic-acid transferase